MRSSLVTERNPRLKDWSQDPAAQGDNVRLLTAVKSSLPKEQRWVGAIGMVGGQSLAANILRRAQARLRWDLRPSYWSHCFLIVGDQPTLPDTVIWECTLEPANVEDLLPERNGVVAETIVRYRDQGSYPNVAVISFPLTDTETDQLLRRAQDPNLDRVRFNLWDLLGRWFPYAWGMESVANPLVEGVRMPAAAYVEMAYEAVGVDLVPGASARNGCPEYFWETALWWWKPFEALGKALRIDYCLRAKQALIADARSTRLPTP
jgi:hypothetical protein